MIKVSGLTKLIKDLNGINDVANKALDVYGKEVVKDAKRLAPRQLIFEDVKGNRNIEPVDISSTISATNENGNLNIDVSHPIAAYAEFGTGIFAADLLSDYPAEWREIAREFYKNGRGILTSSPYLYPAIWINEKTFEEALVKYISKI